MMQVVVASGNSGVDACYVAPANVPEVITVAASNVATKYNGTAAGEGLGRGQAGAVRGRAVRHLCVFHRASCPTAAPPAYNQSITGAKSTLCGLECWWGCLVAASGDREDPYKWTNSGPCIDIFAPGVDIYSACGGPSRCASVQPNSYSFASGTSMATPHVAGARPRATNSTKMQGRAGALAAGEGALALFCCCVGQHALLLGKVSLAAQAEKGHLTFCCMLHLLRMLCRRCRHLPVAEPHRHAGPGLRSPHLHCNPGQDLCCPAQSRHAQPSAVLAALPAGRLSSWGRPGCAGGRRPTALRGYGCLHDVQRLGSPGRRHSWLCDRASSALCNFVLQPRYARWVPPPCYLIHLQPYSCTPRASQFLCQFFPYAAH